MTSLYIHIPFCNRICTYCDFNKFLIKNQPVDAYIDCLIKELQTIKDVEMDTIFIGGGTPTALSPLQLQRLLKVINKQFKVKSEFTMEANPDELTTEKLKVMKQNGVNRLSMGVQTFDEELLKVLGRTHQAEDVENAVNEARALGFESISIDLMYHLPGQTMAHVQEDLRRALELDIQHVSSYSLILEPKTQFYNQYRKGLLQLPDDTLAAEMYDYTMKRLTQAGFHQYEISNYAKAGFESEHNKVYWKNLPYYGAGAGSHGYINDVRYYNIAPVPHYIKAIQQAGEAVKERHEVSRLESMEEFMFLGLRMNDGISEEIFKQRYQVDIEEVFGEVLKELEERNLILRQTGMVALTDEGRMIGNDVFEKFLLSI